MWRISGAGCDRLLLRKGLCQYHDPHIAHTVTKLGADSVNDLASALREANCVVIVTHHSSYDYASILETAKLIIDTRNAIGEAGRGNPKVVRL